PPTPPHTTPPLHDPLPIYALHRRGLPELRDDVGQHAAVHHAAHHVLHARPLAALEQHDAEAAARHRQRRGRAAGAGADDDRVELLGSHEPGFYLTAAAACRAACCTAAVNPAGTSPSQSTPAVASTSAAPTSLFRSTATAWGAPPLRAA